MSLLIALTLSITPHAAFDARSAAIEEALRSPHRHVRTDDKRVFSALADGLRRSATFAQLVRTLDRSDVIVHIQSVDRLPSTVRGRTMLLTKGQSAFRYVRIQLIAHVSLDDLVALVGHELQHAVEIASHPDVRTEAAVRDLYRRIGAGRSDALGFDTEAAQMAGTRIKRELRGIA